MKKIKYEKPVLVELNEENVAQGLCGDGSVNNSSQCKSGGSAPNGACSSGTSSQATRNCTAGGIII